MTPLGAAIVPRAERGLIFAAQSGVVERLGQAAELERTH